MRRLCIRHGDSLAAVFERSAPGAAVIHSMLRGSAAISQASRAECERNLRSMDDEPMDIGSPKTDKLTVYEICGGKATSAADERELADDDDLPPEPMRVPVKPGRNDPCWCASGKKYKKCHLASDEAIARLPGPGRVPRVLDRAGDELQFNKSYYDMIDRERLDEAVRQNAVFEKGGAKDSFYLFDAGAEPRHLLGAVLFEEEQVVLTSNSRPGAEAIRALFESIAGPSVRFLRDESKSLAELMAQPIDMSPFRGVLGKL